MTQILDDATADPWQIIADLQGKLDERTAELAQRSSEYGERIEHQSATTDVLKVMSASPGDPQPVVDLIVARACAFCGADHALLALLDGDMLDLQAHAGMTDAARAGAFAAQFPVPVSATTMFGRAILARDAVQMPDLWADPEHHYARARAGTGSRSIMAVPLLRAGIPIGAIAPGRKSLGEFSTAQVELLKAFAEQAVIATGSAETYRALQTRTRDLQESLEYQTATSDVLKVISRSTFDLQPVLDTLVETAARLCNADQAAMARREGDLVTFVANVGFPPEYAAYQQGRGDFPLDPHSPSAAQSLVRRPACAHSRRDRGSGLS
jgi:two-component system, NtrC family, sensor kinase